VEGLLWPTRLFSVKQEQLAFEEAIVDKQRVYRKKTLLGGLNGWRGVLIGTGLGMALAIGGMHLISGTTSVPAAKSQTRHSKTSLGGHERHRCTCRDNALPAPLTVVAARDLIAVLPQTTGLQIKSSWKQAMLSKPDR